MYNSNPNGYRRARRSSQESKEFIVRRFLKDEFKNQERVAQRYRSILEKARGLLEKYMAKAKEGKGSLADSAFCNESDSLIHEFIVLAQEDEERKMVLEAGRDGVRPQRKQILIDSLQRKIASRDVGVKWDGLVKLLEKLTHRGSAIKLMQREAEGVCLGLLHYGISEIYRKIRKNLTVPEKRAFILVHFRQYKVLGGKSPVLPFAGRMPARERVIWDFFEETGDRTKGLVYSALIFKSHFSAEQTERFAEELRNRWNRYLLFYPAWEEITRGDERERKRRQQWKKRTISLETPVAEDEEGNTLTLGDTLEKPKDSERGRKEALKLAERYCTLREVEILKLKLEGYSEQEIADIAGKKESRTITQQAISKIIKKAIRKIVEGDSRTK